MHVSHLRRCVQDMLPRTMPRVARRSATLRRAQLQRPVECQKPWLAASPIRSLIHRKGMNFRHAQSASSKGGLLTRVTR